VKKIGILLVVSLILVIMASLVPARIDYAQGQASAEVGLFSDYEVAPGDRIEMPIQIRNVTDLYAVDLTLTFDPTVVTVEDGNRNRPGVQPALGTFLEAGMTLFNTVDVEEGRVHFAMSQVNPSEPKSGDGILLVLYLRGVAEGIADFSFINLEMSDRFGDAIPGTPVDGRVTVSGDAVQSDVTAIPVQDTNQLVEVPTLEATEVPPMTTATQVNPTSTKKQTQISVQTQATVIENEKTSVEKNQDETFSILSYWWVAIVVSAVAGIGIYLFRLRA